MGKVKRINWLDEPEEHDYPAAANYLSLIYDQDKVDELVHQLEVAPITEFKAKDLFRASALTFLGLSNSHVEKNRKKVAKGQALSPLLLVRDSINGKVIIADGYHRACFAYTVSEDVIVPCKIV